MAFASKLKDDDAFTIPQEAVQPLGLHSGDEITIRIETSSEVSIGEPDQVELQRRAAHCFAKAGNLTREPGKPLSDSM